MKALAESIATIIYDYHSYNNFNFDANHVLNWISQFNDNDQKFILEEFLHLLHHGIYVSELTSRSRLIDFIESLSDACNFASILDFLARTEILHLQEQHKSQSILLKILDEELQKKYKINLAQCGSRSVKYSVYVDDIIATGNTVFTNLKEWLKESYNETTNYEEVVSKRKILIVYTFCRHNWNTIDWRLKLEFDDRILNKIIYTESYEVQNHRGFKNQKLNFAFPLNDDPDLVEEYFKSITSNLDSNIAFRKEGTPSNESFYSSPENRNRFEKIILRKGIELLNESVNLKQNHRPLGATTPSHGTLGTGTFYFTWRNVSNTTPIVFWWAAGTSWRPLFKLINRGDSN